MAQKRDYYEVLGLDKSADDAQIKKAYWKLAKKHHPDVNPGDETAEKLFKEANEAYGVLSDKEKRQRYDQFGHAGVDGQGFGGGGFGGQGMHVDLQDLFNSLFGDFGFAGAGFGGRGARRQGPLPGANLRYRMNLDFMEAAFGTEREISIRKEDLCDSCEGTGSADKSAPETCQHCHGTGQVTRQQQTIFGQMMATQACGHCQGTGQQIKHPCRSCQGSGRAQKSKRLTVQIPAGINEREMLTLRGEGEPGERGGPSGDLYIEIQIRPHPVFSRQGNTSFCDLPITYAQAALGAEVEVPTIDGPVSFKLNEGTQPDEVYTIHGKGIPYIRRAGKRGDHKFRVLIEVPRNLNDKQKSMLRQFEESCNDSNYHQRKGFFETLRKVFSGETKK